MPPASDATVLSEATDTLLRALTKRAYGFDSRDALIAVALLTRGGLCSPLPGAERASH
jgi:transposase